MKDYLLKREAKLIEAVERLEYLYRIAWQTGEKDVAIGHAAGQRVLMDRLSEVQAALKFLNGGQNDSAQ